MLLSILLMPNLYDAPLLYANDVAILDYRNRTACDEVTANQARGSNCSARVAQ